MAITSRHLDGLRYSAAAAMFETPGTPALTPICRPFRSLAIAASLLLLAGSVGGCGRRGPLELPPETQARGDALRAEQRASAQKEKQGAVEAPGAPQEQPVRIPGTVGNRPPSQYPFPLDPIL
jgi:predicted small lipoprotein YifL